MGVNSHPGGFPTRRADQVPSVSAEQMRDIDRAALEEFGLDILQLMENAGRAAATLAVAMLGNAKGRRVVAVAGGGNVGGAGLVALRHLANAGAIAEPVLGFIPGDEVAPAIRRQVHILEQSRITEAHDSESSEHTLEQHLEHADLIIDALVGYGAQGPLPGLCAAIAHQVARCDTPVLALDGPSGFNSTTGDCADISIAATTTLAYDLPKSAMVQKAFRANVGELYVADIGIPARAHARASTGYNGLYSEGPIVRIR